MNFLEALEANKTYAELIENQFKEIQTLRTENERLKSENERLKAVDKLQSYLYFNQLQSEREKNAELESELLACLDIYQQTTGQCADELDAAEEKVTKLRAALEFGMRQAILTLEHSEKMEVPLSVFVEQRLNEFIEIARSVLAEIGDADA